MTFTGSIEDRLAIHEFYGAFSYVSSKGDKKEWLQCWTDDCRWKTHLFDIRGKDAISEQWDGLWANFDRVSLLCDIGGIDVNGEQASTKIVVREVIRLKSGGIYKLAGCYEDSLVKQNGRWLLASREYDLGVEELPSA